jgi:hypothetical protein
MSQRANRNIEFRGFIQVYLDESDLVILESEIMTWEEMMVWVDLACSNGYKMSISRDQETRTTKVMMQDIMPTRTSVGWMLSSEGTTLRDSMMGMRYKHEAKMGSDWVPFCNQPREVKRFR